MTKQLTMTPRQKAKALAALRNAIEVIEAIKPATPCATCGSFKDGYCGYWKDDVLPETQADGCDQWFCLP